MPSATTQNKQMSDPIDRVRNMSERLTEIIGGLRADIERVEEPQFRAMFETAAEVLVGLVTAFRHYEEKSEHAWKRQ